MNICHGNFEIVFVMKSRLTALGVFVVTVCMAQANKFEAGDFGIRYGVQFNGSAVQGLTFSGIATANIEVGCGINVQYTMSSTTTNSATSVSANVNNVFTYLPAVSTQQSFSKTINTSITPFVFYHLKIMNNLDVYAGPGLIFGTGPHTFVSRSEQILAADQYYNESLTRTTYPLGYQVGGNLNVGGQYFFYKRLALGVQAGAGVAYTRIVGTENSYYEVNNSGTNNSNNNRSTSSTVIAPYGSKSLSFTTASSIGVNLTFYVGQKAKAARQPKGM